MGPHRPAPPVQRTVPAGSGFSAADIFAYMLSTWQQCCPRTYERFPAVKRLADLVAARPAMQRVIRQNAA